MILSDRDIKRALALNQIRIKGLVMSDIQPASVDLHLDDEFVIFTYGKSGIIDTKQPVDKIMKRFKEKDFVIYPGQIVLASTIETVGLDANHAGRVEGKSSLGRIGLMVHITAGFIDPGNELKITLELVNLSPLPIRLYEGMAIAQICFLKTMTPAERPYGHPTRKSKYYKSTKVEISKNHLNFGKEKE